MRLARLSYVGGRPVFELENGEVWVSQDRRVLTHRPSGDFVDVERTPFGMQAHFNGSYFALKVMPQTESGTR